MNLVKRFIFVVALFLMIGCHKTTTPSSDALVRAAKDITSAQADFDKALTKARTESSQALKPSQDQLLQLNNEMNAKIAADPKYAPLVKQIKDLGAQQNAIVQKDEQAFAQQTGTLQSRIATDNAQIQALTPIVKKEQSLPDSAVFDVKTQTWK
jgi:hypothetical protein